MDISCAAESAIVVKCCRGMKICKNKSGRLFVAAKAFALHLVISICVAALVAFVIFGVWFPYPYRDLAGGSHLFWLMVGVDVVCGPVLTAILFNPAKPKREIKLDLSLIALLQATALAFGIYSISLARPVIQAFESDRFVVVSAAEIDPVQLQHALPDLRSLSWTGPRLVGTRQAQAHEILQSIELSLQGLAPSARPNWWQPYADSVAEVKTRMRPVSALRKNLSPDGQRAVDAAVQKTGQSIEALHYLPLVARHNLNGWVVLLNNQAEIMGYAPVSDFED